VKTALLRQLRFRANAALELLRFDDLPEAERQTLGGVARDPELYGILRPRGQAILSMKSVSHETAALVASLASAAPLPPSFFEAAGDDAQRIAATLVLGEVLEVEHDGAFVCGASASALFAGGEHGEPASLTERLSRDALRYAAVLGIDDPLAIARRLYMYNRFPLSPSWRRRFATPAAVGAYLGANDVGKPWKRSDAKAAEGWLYWRNLDVAAPAASGTWKLYASPAADALPSMFLPMVEVLAGSGAAAFKVGCEPGGLLRPDKLMIYFDRREELERTAAALLARLGRVVAHGVPFSAEVERSGGWLSWGVDPPRLEYRLDGEEQESWRWFLALRLGNAIAAARRQHHPEPWRFALDAVRLQGVNTDTWTPEHFPSREAAG